jgi:hypothetical protein
MVKVGRGAWQQLPAWAIVVGVPIVLAIGWIMPLLGLPLAAFLIIAVAVGTARGRLRLGPAHTPVSAAPARDQVTDAVAVGADGSVHTPPR